MKIVQKIVQILEILFGLATFIAALLSFNYIIIPSMGGLEKVGISNQETMLRGLISPILLAVLTFIGAYFHASRRGIVGFGVILVFGGVLVFLHAVSLLIGSAFQGRPFIGISPGLFAFMTILLAAINTISGYQNKDES